MDALWAKVGQLQQLTRVVPLKTHMLFLSGIAVLVGAGTGVWFFPQTPLQAIDPPSTSSQVFTPTHSGPQFPNEHASAVAFESMRITARSAIVVDLKEGTVLWSKNSALVHPLASITKLMTAVVAAERLPTNASLTVSAEDLTPEGESNLLVGDRWRLRDLLSFTLVTSSNDGAHALANAVQATTQSALAPSTTTQQSAPSFVDAMNIKADQLAMHQTVFRNETGLDESATVSGADGTVGDVAALLRYMHEHHQNLLYPTAEPSVSLSSEITQYKAVNTNPTLEAVDGIIGSKTGYTDLAGGNLAIVFDADIDRPVGVVVLGSTISERFTDVAALTQAARHWYRIQYP